MIAIIGHIDVDPRSRDRLVESPSSSQRATASDEPGCLVYTMSADPANPGRITHRRVVGVGRSARRPLPTSQLPRHRGRAARRNPPGRHGDEVPHRRRVAGAWTGRSRPPPTSGRTTAEHGSHREHPRPVAPRRPGRRRHGSGQGIGRAIAWALADAGCDVVGQRAARATISRSPPHGIREPRPPGARRRSDDIRDFSERSPSRPWPSSARSTCGSTTSAAPTRRTSTCSSTPTTTRSGPDRAQPDVGLPGLQGRRTAHDRRVA